MSYSTLDTSGASVTLQKNDRITAVNGESTEYYVVAIEPLKAARRNPYLNTMPLSIQSTTLTSGSVVPGTTKTIAGQIRFQSPDEIDKEQSAGTGKTNGYFLARNSDQDNPARLLRVWFADKLQGQSYAGAYTFERVTVVESGGDPDADIPSTKTPTAFAITLQDIDLSEQYEYINGNPMKNGDARVMVSKSDVTESQIRQAAYFQITPNGGATQKYILWNQDGIKQGNAHQFEIFLQLVK